jgi:ATP-dependent protease ClpP protease subunit
VLRVVRRKQRRTKKVAFPSPRQASAAGLRPEFYPAFLRERSTLLMHKPSVGILTGGHDDYLENPADRLRKVGAAMVQHYASQMKLAAPEIARRIRHRDSVMGADESLNVGAVDGVVRSAGDVLNPRA